MARGEVVLDEALILLPNSSRDCAGFSDQDDVDLRWGIIDIH